MPAYSRIDWQLLAELSHALNREKLLPVPVLRLLAARGWVRIPDPERFLRVAVYHRYEDGRDMQPIPMADYALGVAELTPAGSRELEVFRREVCEDEVEGIFCGDDPEDDDEDDEDADGLC